MRNDDKLMMELGYNITVPVVTEKLQHNETCLGGSNQLILWGWGQFGLKILGGLTREISVGSMLYYCICTLSDVK